MWKSNDEILQTKNKISLVVVPIKIPLDFLKNADRFEGIAIIKRARGNPCKVHGKSKRLQGKPD